MLSQELEETLRRSLSIAGERHHEFATLEHLLLAMLEDKDALAVMNGCNLDVSRLREMLESYIDGEMDELVAQADEIEVNRRLLLAVWCNVLLSILNLQVVVLLQVLTF